MSDLYWLTDEQMVRLRPYFPKSHGKPRVDDRRVLSGIVFVNRNGLRWCDAPKDYGPHKTLYNRWKRWGEKGIFLRVREGLSAASVTPKTIMIDSTYPKAHRTASSLRVNVWPAPSASGLCLMFRAVCENVSGLSTRGRWPRWRSARPGPHKEVGIECHF